MKLYRCARIIASRELGRSRVIGYRRTYHLMALPLILRDEFLRHYIQSLSFLVSWRSFTHLLLSYFALAMRRFIIDNLIELAIFLFGVASFFYRLESNFAFVFNYEKKEVAKLAFIYGHNRTIVPYFRFREGMFHQLESLLSRESAYELTLVS